MRMAEQPGGGRVETEPAYGEHARQMAVGDDRHIAVAEQGPDPVQHRVRARGHLRELLAGMVGATGNDTVPPQLPAGPRHHSVWPCLITISSLMARHGIA